MKLLVLTNRYYITSILLIFIIGSLFSYAILESIIDKEFNEKLYAERDQFIYEWHTYENLSESLYLNIGDRIEVKSVKGDPNMEEVLKDTVMFDAYENKRMNFRKLTFVDQLNGQYFIITITKSLLPNEDLIEGIGEIMLLLLGMLVVALVAINRWIAFKVWQPFHKTLTAISGFNITKPEPIKTQNTNIDEFSELNSVLENMTTKSQKDYVNLKEFTENASHEIQTPLAIIKAKAELLIQDSSLEEDDIKDIKDIYDAANRLSRLKERLSLLSKIENDQFEGATSIDLNIFILNKIENMEELITLKRIKLIKKLDAHPMLLLNSDLADVLISNLLKNAVKHNIEDGEIEINLSENELVIENTGIPLKKDPDSLFVRFNKDTQATDSSGLGLAIVKKISDLYGFKLSYSNSKNIHRLTLEFKNSD